MLQMLLFSWQYLGLYLGAHLPLSYRPWQAGWVPYPTLLLATYKYWVGGFHSLGEFATTPNHSLGVCYRPRVSVPIHYLWVCLPTAQVHALGFVSANRPT